VAGLLKGCCRRSDVVARLGEPQFAILGVDALAPSAQVMRNRLEQHVEVHNRTRSPWGPIDLRTSIGCWSPPSEQSFAKFLDSVESQLRFEAAESMPEKHSVHGT
jgi:GGDEF domain-containing protein